MERSPSPWLIATHDILPGTGQGHPSYALARRLVDLGTNVHLIANRLAGDLRRERRVEYHPIARPQGSTVLGDFFLDRCVGRVIRRLGLDPRSTPIVAMGGNVAMGTINWVHYVHHAWSPSPLQFPRSLSRIKHGILHAYERGRERRALNAASLVIANSMRTQRDIIERLGLPRDRIHVVYYGSDGSYLQPVTPDDRHQARKALGVPTTARVVAFVGGLGRDGRKGFDLLLRAWKLRSERFGGSPGFLLVAGSGDLDSWGRIASDAGLGAYVRFLGYRSDVATILAASDLLVSPTRYEAYGLNVHEAICRGVPALVSKSAGVAERYPPELRAWLLDDPDDVVTLERIIGDVLDAQGPTARMCNALDSFAKDLKSRSWDDMADDIIQLWHDKVGAAGRR